MDLRAPLRAPALDRPPGLADDGGGDETARACLARYGPGHERARARRRRW